MLFKFCRYVVVALFTFILSGNCFHAAADVTYTIQVVDSILGTTIPKAEALVFLPGDSVLVTEASPIYKTDGIQKRQILQFGLPERDTVYHVMVDAPGYDTRLYPLTTKIPEIGHYYVDLGKIALLRTPKRLDEVTVTATKIKMYYKGDTVIFNADAFLLPEGSMLDDLIKKLNGVSIDRNGQIFFNGRKIESLQLSGRELFGGDHSIMFQNIGAYAVNKIKIYKKESDKAKFLGYSDDSDKPMIMDVHLKKEYAIGKTLNLNGGYGTENRYLGRAAFLGYSDHFALTATINANNLSDGSDPGITEYMWSPDRIGTSETSCLAGSLKYQYDGPRKNRHIDGSVSVTSLRTTKRDGSEGINYIQSGNTFESQFSTERNDALSVATYHNLRFNSGHLWFSAQPSFTYSRDNADSSLAAATFNDDPGSVSAKEIEAIFSGSEERLRDLLINRNLKLIKANSSFINGNLNSSLTMRLPDAGSVRHNIEFGAYGTYSSSKMDAYERQWVNYGSNPVAAINRYAYAAVHPTNSYKIRARAKYEANIRRNITVRTLYDFNHNSQLNTNNRYLLATDTDGATLESLKFGQQPTEEELAGHSDPDNSKRTDYRANEHAITLTTRFRWGEKNLDTKGAKGELILYISPSLKLLDRQYDYHKWGYDTVAVRKNALAAVNATMVYELSRLSKRRSLYAELSWNSLPGLFSMDNIINASNTTNPLNIFKGNPNLRNQYEHTAGAAFSVSKQSGLMQHHSVRLTYSFTNDRILRGVVYNTSTGVRTTSMYNVDGNRTFTAAYSGGGDIVKRNDSRFNTMTYRVGLGYMDSRTVGLIGISTADESADITPERTFIYSKSISPLLGLSCQFGNGHSIDVSAGSYISHYSGEETTPFTAAETDYTFRTSFILPYSLSLQSSLIIRSRRGYNDSKLNTDQFILTGSIGWSIKRVHFSLDGYDLLRQIKSISYIVNAYGRSESWSNTVPSYIMLRLRYYLDLQPKK